MDDNNKLVTAKEAADLDCLGGNFTDWKLYDLAKKKMIPHVRIGRRVFFRPASLREWMNNLEKASVNEK